MKCYGMTQNDKMLWNAIKCYGMLQNAVECYEIVYAMMLQNATERYDAIE